MNPHVSIVIPHFNRSGLLAETLRSVRCQTRNDWEVVVVDDGSTDEEWRAVRAFADGEAIRVLQREEGAKGPSRCRNLGLREARGEFVIFLDSDDLLAPWCLDSRVSALRESPDLGFLVFPVLLFSQAPGDSDVLWNRLEGSDDLERFLRSDPPWCVSSPIWRREALSGLGGFNERMLYGDDAELHARALLDGVRYRKMTNMLPDCFIRRSDCRRVTNGLSPDLVQSRRIRLNETYDMLSSRGGGPPRPPIRACRAGEEVEQKDAKEAKAADFDALLGLWEGEFFAEAEFLLFNAPQPSEPVRAVLADLRRRFRPGPWRRLVVGAYFRVALATRQRMYLALRVARRLAMLLLPDGYFNRPSSYQAVRLPAEAMEKVKAELQALEHGGAGIARKRASYM